MKIPMVAGGLLLFAVCAAGSGYAWASWTHSDLFEATYETHSYALQVPTPLTEAEVAGLREPAADRLPDGVDVQAIALERALERGQHLVESRYACVECHGEDFSGGEMLDAPPMGTWLGPNLTSGKGGVVSDYTTEDWDRIVRHGVRKDGRAVVMPSIDFVGMSDQELSDIIVWISAAPPVDNEVPGRTFGPISTLLFGTGQIQPAAVEFGSLTEHAPLPPTAANTIEFGAHLAQTCTGCHREDFSGGAIRGGDPSWPPAANLTAGEGGVLPDYDLPSFDAAMRSGTGPNGAFADPMSMIPRYTSRLTEVEMKALWTYLQSLEPKATGG